MNCNLLGSKQHLQKKEKNKLYIIDGFVKLNNNMGNLFEV